MLDLSGMYEEESHSEEQDDGETITGNGGSSFMPSTSARDKEDGVSDLGVYLI